MIGELAKAEYANIKNRFDFKECMVCLLEFSDEEQIIMMPCSLHFLHLECGGEWLKQKGMCPLCRT